MRSRMVYIYKKIRSSGGVSHSIRPPIDDRGFADDVYKSVPVDNDGSHCILDAVVLTKDASYDFTIPCLDRNTCLQELTQAIEYVVKDSGTEDIDVTAYYINKNNKHLPISKRNYK